MAKKKQELEFEDYEDEAEGDEYAEGEDEEYEDEDDDEYEDDDEPKKGSMTGVLLGIIVVILLAGGAAYYVMSEGQIPFLSSLPIPFLHKPAPAPTPELAAVAGLKAPLSTEASGSHGAALATSGEASGSTGAKPHEAPAAKQASTKTNATAVAAMAKKPASTEPAKHAEAKHAEAKAAAHGTKVAKTAKPAHAAKRVAAAHREHPVVHVAARRRWSRRGHRIVRRWHSYHPSHRRYGGSWAVQVGAFSEPGNATRLIASLKAKGYLAYPGGQSVVAGHFSVYSNTVDTHAKALELAKQFQAAGQHPRVIRHGGHYVVWLGSFGSQGAAQGLVHRLNAKGLFASVSGHAGTSAHASGPNRVMVGHYSSLAAAEAAASRLRAVVGAGIVVRR